MPLTGALVDTLVKPVVGPLIGAWGGASGDLLVGLGSYHDLSEASGTRENTANPGTYDLTEQNTVGQAAGVGAGQFAADLIVANDENLSLLATAGAEDLVPGTGDYTVLVWIRPDSGIVSSTAMCVATYPGDAAGGWHLAIDPDLGRFNTRVDDNASGSDAALSSGPVGDMRGGWHLVVMKFDRTLDVGTIKADDTVQTFFAPPNDFDLSGVADIQMGAIRYLALATDGFLPAASYWGRIQALGIYNRLTTDDEDTWFYNSGTAARLYADVAAF